MALTNMRIFKTIILAILFLFFASWFYKIVVLMLLAHTWRKEIKAKKEWGYRAVMGVLFIAMFCVLPRYRYNTSDRAQLIYQDKKGNPEYPPLTHYLVNVFFPEEEVCNIGIWGARIVPKVIPLANWILDEFNHDDKKGNIINSPFQFKRLNGR